MPYAGPEARRWRLIHANEGKAAMNASLLDCLDQTKAPPRR